MWVQVPRWAPKTHGKKKAQETDEESRGIDSSTHNPHEDMCVRAKAGRVVKQTNELVPILSIGTEVVLDHAVLRTYLRMRLVQLHHKRTVLWASTYAASMIVIDIDRAE